MNLGGAKSSSTWVQPSMHSPRPFKSNAGPMRHKAGWRAQRRVQALCAATIPELSQSRVHHPGQEGDQVAREMTILFSDIRSFATLSEEMAPRRRSISSTTFCVVWDR